MNKKKYVSDRIFKGYGIELRPVFPYDLPSLRRWRNTPVISQRMRDSSYITPHRQRLWYEQIRDRADQAHWVVWCKGVRTGYVNVKGDGPLDLQVQVDVGLYVGDSPVRHGLLGYAMAMMQLAIIFEHLTVLRVQTVIQDDYRVRRFNQQLGYRDEGCKGCKDGFIRIAMDLFEYKTTKKKFARYFDDDQCRLIG